MSCMLLHPAHYEAVGASLVHYLNAGKYWTYSMKRRNGEDWIKDSKDISRVMNAAYRLNELTYCLRYQDHEGTRPDKTPKRVAIGRGKLLSLPALSKALQSIQYQIETEHIEGDGQDPKTNELWHEGRELTTGEQEAMEFLTKASDALAHHFMREAWESDETTNDAWCIEPVTKK